MGRLLKVAAVASSIGLVGTYIGVQAGCIESPFARRNAEAGETTRVASASLPGTNSSSAVGVVPADGSSFNRMALMPGSKSAAIAIPEQTAPPAILLSGSKSGPVDIPTASPVLSQKAIDRQVLMSSSKSGMLTPPWAGVTGEVAPPPPPTDPFTVALGTPRSPAATTQAVATTRPSASPSTEPSAGK